MAPDELVRRLTAQIEQADTTVRGLVTAQQFDLAIRREDRHFWSPQLVVHVTPKDGGCSLTGHFGPNPNMWTAFMASYGFVVCCAITGTFYGLSQLMLDRYPWALWSIPVAIIAIAMIYIAAGVGQRLGRDQVDVLLRFLERAVEE